MGFPVNTVYAISDLAAAAHNISHVHVDTCKITRRHSCQERTCAVWTCSRVQEKRENERGGRGWKIEDFVCTRVCGRAAGVS